MSSIKNNQYIPEIIGYNPVQEVGSITNIYPETIPEHDISYGYDNQSLDSGVALRNLGRSAYKTQIVRTKTASYTITLSDYTILGDTTSGAITLTLPKAKDSLYKTYCIKKINNIANNLTIQANGSETIDGTNTKVLTTQYDSRIIQSDGTAWYILSLS